MRSILAKAVSSGHLREIDRQAALFLHRLSGGEKPELLLATALASQAVGHGHICLVLESIAGTEMFAPDTPCRVPDLSSLQETLLSSGVVGNDQANYPLVLDRAGRLYFARHYRAEQ